MPLKRLWGFTFLFGVLFSSSALAYAGGGLAERLAELREHKEPVVSGAPVAAVRLLDDFYRRRDYRYVWHGSERVEGLLRLAQESVGEGLQPGDFHAREIEDIIAAPVLSVDPQTPGRADIELLLSDALLRLIHHRRYGKVDPQRLDKESYHVEGPYADDLLDDLERVVAVDDLGQALADLLPIPTFYRHLEEGLGRYRSIASAGGWPTIPAGEMLRPGTSDDRIPLVRERLRVTGEYRGPVSDDRSYDQDLVDAVRAFQERHHLAVDAIVGPQTRAAMNIPVAERVDQIRVNLERMRWIYDGLPSDYLLVDITGQQLRLLRDDEVVWSTRVIIGRPERPTPAFRDQLEYLEINPSWTVPPTILKKDILPAMRKNRGYLDKKGLQVVTRDGKRVSPGAVDWHAPASRFPYMIRQPPGARNALGQIKFMFPNRFSVYLHDTPGRSLFKRRKRLYSSGCVRVERPLELAELVLNDPARWSREKLKEITATSRTRWLHLDEPLSVILAYWTARGGNEGEVLFREDIYGWDAAVLDALDGSGPIRILYREPVTPSPTTDSPVAGNDPRDAGDPASDTEKRPL